MDFLSGLSEISEASEVKGMEEHEISKESNEKFDKLMGDDKLREVTPEQQDNRPKLSPVERENKFNRLFEIGDFFKKDTVQSELANSEYIEEDFTDEQKEKLRELTGWSDEILDASGSWEEAEIYMKADLKEVEINGKKCLIRDDIDLDQEDEDGITNRERMERGRPPITKDREEIELHHIGQKQSSPLAELTMEQHRGVGNDTILHDKTKETEIDRNEFGKERHEHWKDRIDAMEGGE